MVIRVPYAGGIGGVEHHCDSSEAYYAHTPGPEGRHPGDRRGRLLRCCGRRSTTPTRWSSWSRRSCYWSKEEVDLPARYRADRHAPSCAAPGTDATLIAYGPSVPVALEAAEAAARGGPGPRGRRPAHRSCRSTTRRSCASVRRTGRCVVVARGARLRRRRRRDRRPGHRALLPLPGRAGPAGHRASTSRTRRRSWSTTTCPASTGSSTPSTTCSGTTPVTLDA